MHDLLARLADRDLAIERVVDDHGAVRVLLRMPSWDDVVAAAVDEVAVYAAPAPTAMARLRALVEDLAELAPPSRRAALTHRLPALPAMLDR